jgi:hypothetical protein
VDPGADANLNAYVDPDAHANLDIHVDPDANANLYAQPGDANAYVVDGLPASAGWDDHDAGR